MTRECFHRSGMLVVMHMLIIIYMEWTDGTEGQFQYANTDPVVTASRGVSHTKNDLVQCLDMD